MSIFATTDYRTALREAVATRRQQLGNRVTFEKMAKACGVQKTYMSRVLNSTSSYLSQDQLFEACRYLGFAKDERRYVSLLLEAERSTCVRRREELQDELDALRRRHKRSEAFLKTTPSATAAGAMVDYFLDPEAILVHVFMTTETYSADVGLLQRRLGLSDARLSQIMAQLQAHRLIAVDAAGRFRVLTDRLHLPADAPIFPAYRAMQRLKTVERLRQLSDDRAYSFSAVFTADEATRRRVHEKLLGVLGEIEALAAPAPAREVYQVNLDLFDWSL